MKLFFELPDLVPFPKTRSVFWSCAKSIRAPGSCRASSVASIHIVLQASLHGHLCVPGAPSTADLDSTEGQTSFNKKHWDCSWNLHHISPHTSVPRSIKCLSNSTLNEETILGEILLDSIYLHLERQIVLHLSLPKSILKLFTANKVS